MCHIDTLTIGKPILKFKNNIITNILGILGADDRAGVYACLELIESENCSVLFTNFEEKDGIGVKKFIDDYPYYFANTKLFIELDRHGNDNYVSYTYLPIEIKSFIEEHTGFVESYGSYSDIYDLSSYYNIPAVNLAIGFYNEHTIKESLNTQDLAHTIEKVKSILNHRVPSVSFYNANFESHFSPQEEIYDEFDVLDQICWEYNVNDDKRDRILAILLEE